MNKIFSLSIIALRESFLTILPYVVLMSSIGLLSYILHLFGFDFPAPTLLSALFPVVIFISILYHFSTRHNTDFIISFIISIFVFLSIKTIIFEDKSVDFFYNTLGVLSILVPITTVLMAKKYRVVSINLLVMKADMSDIVKNIWLFTKVYVLSMIFYVLLYFFLVYVYHLFDFDVSHEYLFLIRSFFVQLFWFFGIHGGHMFTMLVGTDFMQHSFLSSMSYGEILNLFIVNGGSGAILALIIAIFIGGTDTHSRKIAKISLPFSIFNISEIMIFGLPIIFNRYLFLPFILIPLLNIVIVFFTFSIFSRSFCITDIL